MAIRIIEFAVGFQTDEAAGTIPASDIAVTPAGNISSTTVQAALEEIQTDLDGHKSNTSNPHSVTKSQVGLANVDNTSDVNKPVSTAQAAADATVLTTAEAYTDTKIAALINAAPVALDTLSELATALGNDASFSATTATALGNRLRVDTAAQGLNGTQKTNAKTNIDLQNVDNTSDTSKPVSTAQAAADAVVQAYAIQRGNHTGTQAFSTITGTVPVNQGGTGQATANDALNALLPSQTSNSGKVLTSDGTNASWAAGLTSVLASASIFVGNASNVATAVVLSGVISLSNTGVAAFASGAFGSNNISTTGTLLTGQAQLGPSTGGGANTNLHYAGYHRFAIDNASKYVEITNDSTSNYIDASAILVIRTNAATSAKTAITGSTAGAITLGPTSGLTGSHTARGGPASGTPILDILHTGSAGNNASIRFNPAGATDGGDILIGGTGGYHFKKASSTTDILAISNAGIITSGESGSTGGLILNNSTASYSASTLDYYEENSFTMTATGMTTSPTASWRFVRIGKAVTINILAISGTSNSSSFSVTGLPDRLKPARDTYCYIRCGDNGTALNNSSVALLQSSTGTVTLYPYNSAAANGWTSSGTKAIYDCTISYVLN